MDNMELIVSTDLTKLNPQEIIFNKNELKAELAANLDKYKGLIVTEDSLPQAKAIRATVNKVATQINDEKKRIKKIMSDPVTRFENDVKELLAMCDSVSSAIDVQIKAYEEATKAAKKATILNTFEAATANISEYVSFDEVFEPRWLNATVDISEAEKAIDQFSERRKMDVDALEEIDAEPTIKAMLVSRYKQTKNLSDVLRLKKEIEERARIEAERAEKITEDRARAEAERAERAAVVPEVPVVAPYVLDHPDVAILDEPECVTYKITASGVKIAQLEAYMNTIGILFEEVF